MRVGLRTREWVPICSGLIPLASAARSRTACTSARVTGLPLAQRAGPFKVGGNYAIDTHANMGDRIRAAATLREEAKTGLGGSPILVIPHFHTTFTKKSIW